MEGLEIYLDEKKSVMYVEDEVKSRPMEKNKKCLKKCKTLKDQKEN